MENPNNNKKHLTRGNFETQSDEKKNQKDFSFDLLLFFSSTSSFFHQ